MSRPASAAGQLARFGFTDSTAAAARLGPDGLGLWADHRPVDAPAQALLLELAGCADPDLALRALQSLAATDRAVVAAMKLDERLRTRLCAVLGASSALGDDLATHPGRWRRLAGAGGEEDPGLAGAGDARSLRAAYRTELLRIAADDLSGATELTQTMARLSGLADGVVGAALRLARAQRGTSAGLAVIAMGKCGGRELNYVSDVDVIFVCEGDADLTGATVLATDIIRICGEAAWPVDASLRPEGSRGPLVRTLASHLAYYQRWAHLWEFQAMLKARPMAGDLDLGQRWCDGLSSLLWRAIERPDAVDEVRQMRRRIIDSVPARERDREIKRGPGGLRDIEFAVQLLQLVHARTDESLRSTSTLDALAELTGRGYVGREDGRALAQAYRFLRTVEHRLQLQRLRRTHTVPDAGTGEGAAALRWLARGVGFCGAEPVAAFRAAWAEHSQRVRRLHTKLVYRPLVEAVARVPAEALRLSPDAAKDRLVALGFRDPAGALRHLQALTGGVSRNAAIQSTLLPVLLHEFAEAPEPDRGLLAYRQVSDKLRPTPWFLRLLRDEGPVAQRLARLLGLSAYVTALLVRDPEALRLLADDAELAPRPVGTLAEGFTAAADRYREQADEDAVAAVRALRRRELLRVACADMLGLAGTGTPARPGGAEVGQALTDITDATLAAALRTVRDRVPVRLPFAVIGMGRLGGAEMGYASDADVLFVYDVPEGATTGESGEAAATAHHFAEALRRLLSVPSPEPPLGIDAGLRPEGRQGPLVRSLGAYQRYYLDWSKIWEAQALLRARFVCGDAEVGERFLALADRWRYPSGGLTPAQVTEIRRIKARVSTERLPRGADPATHTKLGRGGLADVEWAVQLLQLRHAGTVAGLRTPRTLAAIDAAESAGLLDGADALALAAGWRSASRVRNALMLVRGKPADQLPRQGTELAAVTRILAQPATVTPGEFLDDYLRTARRSHAAAQRVLLGP